MKNKSSKQRGITLIALVVTIVVLLILAGVSISMLTGENGIIRQALEAKDKNKIGEEKEIVALAAQGAKENGYGDITKQRLKEELDDLTNGNAEVIGEGPFTVKYKDTGREYNVDIKGNTSAKKTLADLKESEDAVEGNTILEDENGDKITIPDGFNVDKYSPITVEKGIVIEDNQENQFVWIPVFEKSDERTWGVDYIAAGVTTAKTAERTSFNTTDYTAIQNALKIYTATYTDNAYTDAWFGKSNNAQHGYYNGTEFIYYTNGNMTESEYNNLYQDMLVSVYKHGGFYIGRYEMGTGVATSVETAQSLTRTSMTEYTASEDTNTSTTVVVNGEPSIEGMPVPVSKADAVAYTYITQSQAQMLAEEMGREYGNTTSSLMFGIQWNAVCVFLEKCGKTNNGTKFDSTYLNDSTYGTLWGNYYSSTFTMNRGYYTTAYSSSSVTWNTATTKETSENWLCTTGASEQNSVLNIYDFGGNLYEYTLEYCSSKYPAVYRGGSFYVYGQFYASSDYNYYVYDSGYSKSSRISLFL